MAWPGWEHFRGRGGVPALPNPPDSPKRHKYHATPTAVDGHLFPSKREADRYAQLRLLERAGALTDLRLQFRFPLAVKDQVIGHYVADFTYTDAETGGCIVEDAKGARTPLYAWKKNHFRAQYGIEVQEV